jgi:hypothetical protein
VFVNQGIIQVLEKLDQKNKKNLRKTKMDSKLSILLTKVLKIKLKPAITQISRI